MSNNINLAPSCRIISVFVGVKRFFFKVCFFLFACSCFCEVSK